MRGDAAVPLTVFTLDYCIRYPAASVTDVAARELATVERSLDEDDVAYESRWGGPPVCGLLR